MRSSDFFMKALNELTPFVSLEGGGAVHWSKSEWRRCWLPLDNSMTNGTICDRGNTGSAGEMVHMVHFGT